MVIVERLSARQLVLTVRGNGARAYSGNVKYVYLFRCMSRLGMLIRVTARAVLSIVNGEANFVDPAERQWCYRLSLQ